MLATTPSWHWLRKYVKQRNSSFPVKGHTLFCFGNISEPNREISYLVLTWHELYQLSLIGLEKMHIYVKMNKVDLYLYLLLISYSERRLCDTVLVFFAFGAMIVIMTTLLEHSVAKTIEFNRIFFRKVDIVSGSSSSSDVLPLWKLEFVYLQFLVLFLFQNLAGNLNLNSENFKS